MRSPVFRQRPELKASSSPRGRGRSGDIPVCCIADSLVGRRRQAGDVGNGETLQNGNSAAQQTGMSALRLRLGGIRWLSRGQYFPRDIKLGLRNAAATEKVEGEKADSPNRSGSDCCRTIQGAAEVSVRNCR